MWVGFTITWFFFVAGSLVFLIKNSNKNISLYISIGGTVFILLVWLSVGSLLKPHSDSESDNDPGKNLKGKHSPLIIVMILVLWIPFVTDYILNPKTYEFWTRDKTVEGRETQIYRSDHFNSEDECKKAESNVNQDRLIGGYQCKDTKPTREQIETLCKKGSNLNCKIGEYMDAHD